MALNDGYDEANWAKFSPRRRNAMNHLRKLKGLPPIPPPAVDLYVEQPSRPQLVVPIDAATIREIREMGEGAGLRSEHVKDGFDLNPGAGIAAVARQVERAYDPRANEGFRITPGPDVSAAGVRSERVEADEGFTIRR